MAVYSRPYKDVIVRRKFPSETGYAKDLYKKLGVPDADAYEAETVFLQKRDDEAAKVMSLFRMDYLDWDDIKWTPEKRSAWSRFLISLARRNPEEMARLKGVVRNYSKEYAIDFEEEYRAIRGPDDPETVGEIFSRYQNDDWHDIAIDLVMMLIDSQRVCGVINGMCWGVVHFENLPYTILTSDRPVIMTNGLIVDDAHIILPISSSKVFVAAKNAVVVEKIRSILPEVFVHRLNDMVTRQAEQYVYGSDKRHLRFVENRLRRLSQ